MRNILKKIIPIIVILALAASFLPIHTTLASSALVQTTTCTGGGYVNSYTCSIGTVTATNTLILVITAGNSTVLGPDTPTITDDKSNSWGSITSIGYADERKSELIYAYNVAAGATTITVTFQAARFADSAVIVREYSGLTTTNPYDVSATAADTGTPTTHTSGTTGTTAQANELLIGAGGSSAGGDPVWAAGTGYGNLQQKKGFDVYTYSAIEDQVVGSTGTYSASFTTTNAVKGQAIVATFKVAGVAAAASGGGTTILFQ